MYNGPCIPYTIAVKMMQSQEKKLATNPFCSSIRFKRRTCFHTWQDSQEHSISMLVLWLHLWCAASMFFMSQSMLLCKVSLKRWIHGKRLCSSVNATWKLTVWSIKSVVHHVRHVVLQNRFDKSTPCMIANMTEKPCLLNFETMIQPETFNS